MNIKFLSGVLLCRKSVSFCHFVIQIPEKVITGSTVAKQALRQSMMAVPAIISRWRYAFVKLSKDMMVGGNLSLMKWTFMACYVHQLCQLYKGGYTEFNGGIMTL